MPNAARTKKGGAPFGRLHRNCGAHPFFNGGEGAACRFFERFALCNGAAKRFDPRRNRVEHRFFAALHTSAFNDPLKRHFESSSNIRTFDGVASCQQRARASKCCPIERTSRTADRGQERFTGHVEDRADVAVLQRIEFDDDSGEPAVQIFVP